MIRSGWVRGRNLSHSRQWLFHVWWFAWLHCTRKLWTQ